MIPWGNQMAAPAELAEYPREVKRDIESYIQLVIINPTLVLHAGRYIFSATDGA
jgi:hypothetical protein